METDDIVTEMKTYNTNKRIRNFLEKINPFLAKKENNIRIHLEALVNDLITKSEYLTIERKMLLGSLCLELEELFSDAYVKMMFYNEEENKVYHGAAPRFPPDFSKIYDDINHSDNFGPQCGLSGAAIYIQNRVVDDLTTSYLFKPFRTYFTTLGFKTGWSIPFFYRNKAIGTFTIFHKYKTCITADEAQLVQQRIKKYEEIIAQICNQYTQNA